MNIALVNEPAMLTDRMGIDIWGVVDAAATKPYEFMRLQPSVGDIRKSAALKILTLLSALRSRPHRHIEALHPLHTTEPHSGRHPTF